MKFPILELEDGRMVGQVEVVMAYILKMGGKQDMLGSTAWETAQINHWSSYISNTVNEHYMGLIMPTFGMGGSKDKWEATLTWFSKELVAWEAHLAGHSHWVGNKMTLVDIILWRVCLPLFNFVMGPE